MKKRTSALLLLMVAGCAARPLAVQPVVDIEDRRLVNLERAAKYPWMDEGNCAVREAAGEWKTLIEHCYFALDLSRIQFRDIDHRCPVAQVDAAMVGQMVGICLMVQPELVVGAGVVIGVVVVAAAIAAELKKLPCDCICFGIDDLGQTHGPYEGGRKRSAFRCNEDCLKAGN